MSEGNEAVHTLILKVGCGGLRTFTEKSRYPIFLQLKDPLMRFFSLLFVSVLLMGCGTSQSTIDLSGTSWQIEDLSGQAVLEANPPLLSFDNEGGISGTTGCNRFFGAFEHTEEALIIRPLGLTKMMCGEEQMIQEDRVVNLLQSAERVRSAANGRIVIETTEGEIILSRIGSIIEPAVQDVTSLRGTSWIVDDLAGRGVLDRAEPTVLFGEDGQISGRGGCNNYFGTYTLEEDQLSVGPIGATRMLCADAQMDQERFLFAALEATQRVGFQNDGRLVIETAEGNIVLSQITQGEHEDMEDIPDLENTSWFIERLGDVPTLPNAVPTLIFDDEGRLGGNSGCNSYGADYTRDGNSFSVGQIVSTMMACEEEKMEQENRLTSMLDVAMGVRMEGEKVVILTELGDIVLTSSSATLPQEPSPRD